MPAAFCGLSFRDPSTCDGNSGALASSDPVDIKPVVHNFVCSLFRTAVSTANIVNIKYISDYCYLASQQCPVSRITLCQEKTKDTRGSQTCSTQCPPKFLGLFDT